MPEPQKSHEAAIIGIMRSDADDYRTHYSRSPVSAVQRLGQIKLARAGRAPWNFFFVANSPEVRDKCTKALIAMGVRVADA